MKKQMVWGRWIVVARLLLVLLVLTLVACGSSSVATAESEDESLGLGARIKSIFGTIVDKISSAPLIGGLFNRVLVKLAPDDQWCAGGVVSVLVIFVLVAVFYVVRD